MSAPVHEGLFTAEPARLLGGRCHTCTRSHFPRLAQCPYCGSDAISHVDLADHGTLWAWTAVTAPPPGYQGIVPFGFGIVELPDGLRVITRLTMPVDQYELGQPMRLRIVDLDEHEGVTTTTWEFGP